MSASKMTFPGGAKILFRLIGDVNELAIGGQEYWIDDLCIDGTPVTAPNEGCTDATACNYDQSATQDDGSCTYPETGYDCSGQGTINGCMDSSACNYNPTATIQTANDICIYPVEGYTCSGECTNDADGDGICDENEAVGVLTHPQSTTTPKLTLMTEVASMPAAPTHRPLIMTLMQTLMTVAVNTPAAPIQTR